MKKYRYVFDINSGHYIKLLNEEDSNVTNDTTNTEKSETNQKDQKTGEASVEKAVSVHSNQSYEQLDQQIQMEKKKFDTDIAALKQKLAQAKTKAATSSSATGDYDHVMTDNTVLSIQKQILDRTKQYNDKDYTLQSSKIKLLQTLATAKATKESASERIFKKYNGVINESNIHTAKIYMNNLIANDDMHILKNMHDFKSALKTSDLLYGKDQNGYFIICVDQQDFDRMYDSLQEVGYLRDQIIDTVMPQLMNRQNMIQ